MSDNLSELVGDNPSITTEFQTETFSKFSSIMNLVSKICTDMTIKSGVICQYSDRRHAILDIDIRDLLGDMTLYLSGITSKVDLLEPFKKQGVSVKLEVTEPGTTSGFYIFKDDYSKIEFQKPFEGYLNNKFIPQEDLQSRLSLDVEGRIFEYQVSKFLLERLTALQKGLGASIIKLEFKDGKAHFIVTAGDKTSTITTIGRLMTIDNLERDIEGTCVFPIQPFLMGGDNVIIEGFFRGSGDTIILKLSSTMEDVPVNIWCIAHLINDDE